MTRIRPKSFINYWIQVIVLKAAIMDDSWKSDYRIDYGSQILGVTMTSFKISIGEEATRPTLPKEVWIGWIASLSEAYNMAIYTFTAPFLAKVLFQQETVWSAVFFSYCLIFAGSSLFYPLGATYFGLMGDKRGRNKTCIYSTLGLAIATGMMGLIPVHLLGEQAWVLFFLCICFQYFFSGGEYYGSIVFSLEHSKVQKSGLMSGISCLFAVFGIVAANGLAALSLLMKNELCIKACFFVGACGGLISYILKTHCRETPAFAAIPQESLQSIGIVTLIKTKWPEILGAVLILGQFYVLCSFIFIFLPLAYGDQSSGFDTFKSLMAYGLFLAAAGCIANRFGVAKVILIGAGLLSISIFPLCYFCRNFLTLQMILTVFASLVIGPIHSWMLHHFEVQERCRGIFISSAIAMSVFGGSTVPICLIVFERFHSIAICCIFPFVIFVLSFIYLWMPFSKSPTKEGPSFQNRQR
ncbi:MAG: Permease, family [Parachlamydiales bacterium]|nr:Permease, family [Parachlamydiales bacterium]